MGTSTLTNGLQTIVAQAGPTRNYDHQTIAMIRKGSPTPGIVSWLLYFSRPFPLGATITSAHLKLYSQATAQTGSLSITAKRPKSSVSFSQVTYNTRPTTFYAASVNAARTGPVVDRSEWDFDVTAAMQSVASGEEWFGWEISSSTLDPGLMFYGPTHSEAALRPVLIIEWSDAPDKPRNLAPAGGRVVGVAKPIVRCDYVDVSGSTEIAQIQVQANASNVWTSPTFDSGAVTVTAPELDLAATAFPAMTEGQIVWWRVRVKDSAGLWSDYSDGTSFERRARPTVRIVSPGEVPANIVQDVTPPVSWLLGNDLEKASNNSLADLSHLTTLAGTGGVVALSRVATGGPSNDAFARATWTTGQSGGTNLSGVLYSQTGTDAGLAAAPGDLFDVSLVARCSLNQKVTLYAEFMDAGGVGIGGGLASVTVDLVANVWQRISVSTAAAPAGTVRMRMHLLGAASGTVLFTTGSTLDTLDWSAVKVSAVAQASYQAYVTYINSLGQNVSWTSGRISTSLKSFTIPEGVIASPDYLYILTIRAWDSRDRETTPGDTAYGETSQVFTFTQTTTVTPVTSFAAAHVPPTPKVSLTWTRAADPDSFTILRNRQVIASELTPAQLRVSGQNFAYTDVSPSPQTVNTYEVLAVVNSKSSSGNPTAVLTIRTEGVFLADLDRTNDVLITGRVDRNFTYGEESEVLVPVGATEVVLVTQGLRGLEGTVTGQLHGGIAGVATTAQQWRDKLLAIKAKPGRKLWLTFGDTTIPVVVRNISIVPRPVPTLAFDVSFEFYQSGSLPFLPTL